MNRRAARHAGNSCRRRFFAHCDAAKSCDCAQPHFNFWKREALYENTFIDDQDWADQPDCRSLCRLPLFCSRRRRPPWQPGQQRQVIINRAAGADGLVDRTVMRPGGQTTLDRFRGADRAVDATVTGPRGRTTSIDGLRGADGARDAVITGPQGRQTLVDRQFGADGALDATRTGPAGRTWRVDRSRGADGRIDTTRLRPDGSAVVIDRQAPLPAGR